MVKIIADIGINHDGSIERAVKLGKKSLIRGVDYVKIQIRNPEIAVPKEWKTRRRVFQGEEMDYIDYKNLLEFNQQEICTFFDIFKEASLASVWDIESLYKFLFLYRKVNGKNPDYIKIPSAQATNKELVDKAAGTGIPTIVSLGMTTEVEKARLLRRVHDFIPMVCNSTYPHSIENSDLRQISHIKSMHNFKEVGYSSHCPNADLLPYAVAAGADYIEFHVTDDTSREGTDHAASIDFESLQKSMTMCNEAEMALGNCEVGFRESEEAPANKMKYRP